MKLSILIPTLPEIESVKFFRRLMSVLNPQLTQDIEIISNDSPRRIPTGTKRNLMIAKAQGEYFSQIDCDDLVPDYYVRELLAAMACNPDVITFDGFMTTNGGNKKDFTIKLGEKYEERDGKYYRYPNHLCCYRKSVVENIKFDPIWFQEDFKWSKYLHDHNILKTEVHIPLPMYHYDYNRNKKYYQNRRIKF